MKKRKFNRAGSKADIATLTIHGWFGDLIDRIRAKTNEKERGMLMVNKLENYFNINEFDRKIFRQKLLEREKRDFKEMEEQAKLIEVKPIKWTRDETGKIVSPFPIKKWGGAKKVGEE